MKNSHEAGFEQEQQAKTVQNVETDSPIEQPRVNSLSECISTSLGRFRIQSFYYVLIASHNDALTQ